MNLTEIISQPTANCDVFTNMGSFNTSRSLDRDDDRRPMVVQTPQPHEGLRRALHASFDRGTSRDDELDRLLRRIG